MKWSQHTRHKEGSMFPRSHPVSQTELLPVASKDARRTRKTLDQRQSARHGMWIALSLFFHFFPLFIIFFFSFFVFNFSLLRYHRWGTHTESKPMAQSPSTTVHLNPKCSLQSQVSRQHLQASFGPQRQPQSIN